MKTFKLLKFAFILSALFAFAVACEEPVEPVMGEGDSQVGLLDAD